MRSSWSRRDMLRGGLSVGAAVSLAGCGFHPVYMPTASGKPGPAARDMAEIQVALIPDRPGQLLRQALQQRLYGATGMVAPRYTLNVSYSIAGEGIAVFSDSTPTRIRLIGRASWTLAATTPPHAAVTNGSARAFDGLDILDQQYFAADLQTEQVQRRMADRIADQISEQLAVYFRKRAGLS